MPGRYDPEFTAARYDALGLDEGARWRTSQHMKVQRALYLRHLRQRVRRGDKVLDAGCGPGIFTRELQKIGAPVWALDLSVIQLDLCRERAPGAEAYIQGSICDLSMFDSGTFDVVLALGGVLSYCFEETGTALAEARRVLRGGGVFGCSVMSLLGTVHHFLRGIVDIGWSTSGEILKTGVVERGPHGGHEYKLFRAGEISTAMQEAGFEQLELSASGWLTSVPRDFPLPEPGREGWKLLIESEWEASQECPSAGTHMIAWATKPDQG